MKALLITTHAINRAKQRLNLSHKSLKKLTLRALDKIEEHYRNGDKITIRRGNVNYIFLDAEFYYKLLTVVNLTTVAQYREDSKEKTFYKRGKIKRWKS